MTQTPRQSQTDTAPQQAGRRPRRIWRAALMHILEGVALILALVMAICGGVAWRLAQGPVSLEFLRSDAEASLEQVFEGGEAHIGALQAMWSGPERAIVIAARDVQVLDRQGRVLVKVPQFDVGLTAMGLLQRKMVLQQIVAIGGEFSFVRRKDGTFGAGLGQPDQVVFSKIGATPSTTKQEEDRASLVQLLARLRVLAMRDATLHFVDERAGVNWVAPHANIRFLRKGDQVVASAFGNIESPSGTTQISINASSRSDFSLMSAELKLTNAVPSALLPVSSGAWQWLGGLDAPLEAQINLSTGEDGLLKAADGHLQFAKGVLRKDSKEIPLDRAEIVFDFDPIDGAINIQLAELRSPLIRGNLKGKITGLDPARLAVGERIGFDLSFDKIEYAPENVFAEPVKIDHLWMDGYGLPKEKKVDFRHLVLGLFDLSLYGSGMLTLPDEARGEEDPFFFGTARSDGQITPAQVASLWPVDFAKGGRDWIVRNVLSGRLHDLVLDLRLPQQALQAPHLNNEWLTLSFAFDEANAHFVNAMTPLHNGEGTGLLRGNRFALHMKRAQLLGLTLTDGFVEISRLSPKGVTANFGGHATGSLGDVVKLLDEKPLAFVSRYGFSPESITGQGEVDFSISRPMRVEVSPRKIGFEASGAFKDIRVAGLVLGQDMADASASFTASPKGMMVKGEGKLGAVPGKFTWQETFFPEEDQPRTKLEIDVTTNEQLFDNLGIATRLFVDGPMDIHMTTKGEGMNISSAQIEADMTHAHLMSPGGDWEKPKGQAGQAALVLSRRDDGGYEIKDFEASTEGFLLTGDFSIAAKGGVKSARISRARMDGLFDFSADLVRGRDGAFILDGQAKALDARGFVRSLARGGNADLGFAIEARMDFDEALVSDELTLTSGHMDFKKDIEDIEKLDFKAILPHGKVAFSIQPDATGLRQISGQADDADLVLQALFGLDSVKGGVLKVDGVLGNGKDQHTRLDLTMKDFKLANVPVMARMLTLGSLTGIANTMNGDGIGFKVLAAPLEFDDGKVKIGTARATGPALGITVTGTVDLVEKTMDLNGALAPAYSLNSALGNLPVLGKVLVSRKGEGLFGLSYSVKGPYDALQVFVNPLSALTPGVFRRIFEGGKTDIQSTPKKAGKTKEKAGMPKVKAPNPAPDPNADTESDTGSEANP